jgi:hypothetical protein
VHKPTPLVSGEVSQIPVLTKEELQAQKITQFRQRTKFKSIIRKGDYFSVKNMKESALKYYLNAYSKLPDDNTLELKIGDILFDLKRFEEAYSFYKKIPFAMLSPAEKVQVAKTMYYANTPKKESDIIHLGLPQDEQKYYTSILSSCYTGIHNCILSIQAYSGTYAPGAKLVDTVKNYEKISTDFHYRNALVAGIFLANKDYRATALISDEILSKRPGYMSALKLSGFAHFELGEYGQANTVLQKYYELDAKDIKTPYILGIVNYELGDYVTSNLYYNTAVLNGYQPKTELERRMIYNYFLLDDHKSMFKVFRYLLDESDVNIDDYIIAIYTAIEKRELSKASLWCEKGISRFPDAENLYALQGWIYQIKGEELNSTASLQKALALNPRNVIALLYTGV